jgi:hypothetical protein
MISNNPPVNAGADYTILGTAFVLKGQEQMLQVILTYTWEQNDAAVTQWRQQSGYCYKPDGPLFRSVYPSASSVRYMPPYSNVLSNKLRSKGNRFRMLEILH